MKTTNLNSNMVIETLGDPQHPSPLGLSKIAGDGIADFTRENAYITLDEGQGSNEYKRLERAGPRALTYFEGAHVHAGIVTCGGLCPGLNNVIRDLVTTLWHRYGVRKITGFRYGFDGLTRSPFKQPIQLDPTAVAGIQHQGGTILGSSEVHRILSK